nr:hypothetical protein Hi04_10k_c1000_00039 [uncultured bacterium]
MRKILLSVAGASLLLTGVGIASASDVNCKVVMKNLESGRTEQDIAETMVISVDDVKKCKEQAKSAAPANAPAMGDKPAAAPAGAGGGMGDKK